MSLIVNSLLYLVGFAALLILIMAILSPFESLGWWAGWTRRDLDATTKEVTLSESDITEASHFVVYLTAIGGISSEDISRREHHFLQLLREQIPGVAIIDDVFPYSVSNNPLNGERALAWFWQRIHNSRMKQHAGSILSILIFIRNLFQVAVSADPRYGPMNNVGVANEVAKSLAARGYRNGSGKPITVMGWSGGGQIAVGIVPFLHQSLGAPIYVASIGGVLTDDVSIEEVEHLYHLQGSKDKFPYVGNILYPGRWRLLSYSAWNRAKRAGKITQIEPGPMVHTGRGDYFDLHNTLPSGQTYVERTADIIAGIIADPEKSSSAPFEVVV